MPASPPTAARSLAHQTPRTPFIRIASLTIALLLCRFTVIAHPAPVHGDEDRFIAGIGFPANYPVQPPGYPLWIALGTLTHLLGLPPYAAFQFWSVIASLAIPILLYTILRPRTSDAAAWWLALACGLNPTLWFNGVTALSYAAGAALGLGVIALLVPRRRIRLPLPPCQGGAGGGVSESIHRLYAAGVLLAVSMFLRPDLLLWLGPILLGATLWARRLSALAAWIPIVIAIPLYGCVSTWLYGRTPAGEVPHQSVTNTFDRLFATSVFHLGFVDGLGRNAAKLAVHLAWSLWPVAVALTISIGHAILAARGIQAVGRARVMLRFAQDDTTCVNACHLLLLWTAPLTAFLLLIHMAQPGYILLLIPAAYFHLGLTLNARVTPRASTRIAAAVALCSFVQFVAYPWSAESTGLKRLLDAKVAFQSAAGLRRIDQLPRIHHEGDYWPTPAHQATPAPHTPPAGE